MPLTDLDRLRALLGEDIPTGGTVADTLFSNEEIQGYLDANPDNLERAAYDGWRVKAARLSNLVDTTEGNVQRKFSQLTSNAEAMVKTYQHAQAGPTEGRTRIGRAVRPGVEW
jgi:hypothetical protein